MTLEYDEFEAIAFYPNRLKEIRLLHSYTQSQMAEKLSCSRSAYLSWENGISIPSVVLNSSLVKRFGMGSFLFVMGFTDAIDSEPPTFIDKVTGKALAIAVAECFARAGQNYDAGQIFEIAVKLLESSPDKRSEQLKGIELALSSFGPQSN